MLAVPAARAEEALRLMFGAPDGRHATLDFAETTGPRALVITTHLAGVAGSRLSLSVDKASGNLLDRILTNEECRFAEGGSVCSLAVAGDTATYAAVVAAFKAGLSAHVAIENAGSMEMSEDISLRGFTRSYGGL